MITSLKKNTIRIIGGKYKKSKIPIIRTPGLRPTTNRMRETLFNWINNNIVIKNSHCLDCFSGSGALGIEAVSRNALSVTALDIQKKNINSLKKILQKLLISNIYLIHTNTIKWLKNPKKSYDIIFIDPPFNTPILQKTIILLNKYHWLKKGSLIYIEHDISQNNLFIPKNWILINKKKTNHVNYALYVYMKSIFQTKL